MIEEKRVNGFRGKFQLFLVQPCGAERGEIGITKLGNVAFLISMKSLYCHCNRTILN